MSHQFYRLDENKNPVKCGPALMESRRVAREDIGASSVSTMFLGLDHEWAADAPPVLWETMVFGGPMDEHQERCGGSWKDAEAMHGRVVALVKAAQ